MVETPCLQADARAARRTGVELSSLDAAGELLMIGKTLSHYRITGKLGQGGMGEVYRADDTNLSRQVAIKILPEAFAHEDERLARFEREAKLLASLNHQNIAAIYGLEQADGNPFLVLELVEGQTLAERLQKGGIPLDETLDICRQIAEGLEAAHEKGVIHRDLKPGNVMVTPAGKVKILDFGLAKALAGDPRQPDATHSPTITDAMTRPGVVLGTAAYMSPEQARGKPVDKRADIWAFGCILFECLAGKKAFEGTNTTETLAAILKEEPDWRALPSDVPARVHSVLTRCLRKDPAKRLRDIGDARMELEEAGAEGPVSGAAQVSDQVMRPLWHHPSWIGLAGLVLLLTVALIWLMVRAQRTTGSSTAVSRLSVLLPAGCQLTAGPRSVTISPDGRVLIFVVEEDRGRPGPIDDVIQLYRRSLDDLAATAIQGTEMGADPFFSPDGEWLAFSGPDGLKKVSLRGGAPIAIPGAGSGGTGTWLNDNHLVYTNRRDLFRLPADGGQAELLLNWAQLQKGEISIDAPNSLPNMPAFLLSLQGLDPARSAIAVWSGGALNRIAIGGLMPLYLPTGHMLYQRRTKPGVNQYDAYVLQFEVSSLKVVGKEVPVLEGIRNGQLAVSATGTLAYNGRGTESVVHHLAWVELGGKAEPIQDKQQGQYYLSPRISPDGARLLYSMSHSNADSRLFVQDMATRASHMVGGIAAWEGVWTPDSRRVVFIQLNPEHTAGNLFWQAADGTGPAERLTKGDRHQQPLFVTPDGSSLVFNEQSLDTGYDLWQLSLQGDHTPRPLLQSKANEHLAAITQDGRYMAYVSDQSGRDEIWVSSFPEVQGAQQVSTEGGTGPLYAPDGKTLYYRDAAATRLFAVPVTWQPGPAFGAPMVTNGWWVNDYPWVRQYDITPDGKRFVMIVGTSTAGNEITVVQNWLEEVKRLVPVK